LHTFDDMFYLHEFEPKAKGPAFSSPTFAE